MKVHRMKALFSRGFVAGARVQDDPCEGETRPTKSKMSKVPSLLFDIELEENLVAHHDDEAGAEAAVSQAKTLSQLWSVQERKLAQQVVKAEADAHACGEMLDSVGLAQRLRESGHHVTLRTALGGGDGGECLRNLRHTFLMCIVSDDKGSMEYVVDPKFREQFSIASNSPRYERVLAAVPATFVGLPETLTPLVEFLCSEMAVAFDSAATSLPPWRAAGSMLSKWKPRRSEDVQIASASRGGGNGAVSETADLAGLFPATVKPQDPAAVAAGIRRKRRSARGIPVPEAAAPKSRLGGTEEGIRQRNDSAFENIARADIIRGKGLAVAASEKSSLARRVHRLEPAVDHGLMSS